MGKKSKTGNLNKARRIEENNQRQAVIKAAYELGSPFELFTAFSKFDRGGIKANLQCATPDALTEDLKVWIRDILERNMKPCYGSEWATASKDKEREMLEPDARYIFAYIEPEEPLDQEKRRDTPDTSMQEDRMDAPDTSAQDPQNGRSDLPVAFMHYRFVVENDREVLYVYELQLTENARSKGLGKFLMQIAELLARKTGMKGVMLTVQRRNNPARKFYTRLKYILDDLSPAISDPLAPIEDYSYEILSKRW